MYEELIKALRNVSEYDSGYAKLMHDAADAIEELSRLHEAQRQNLITLMNEEPEPKWIPVTERLPEMYEAVLGVNDDGICHTAERTESFDTKDDWAIHYCLYDADAWDEEENGVITHWMPLPEPPKEG